MLKKVLLAISALFFSVSLAFAGVEVNKADQAALDGVKGLGPAKSKAILEERTKNGDFKDWADFQKRVKGIGDKVAAKLSTEGLTVNGQARDAAAGKADAKAAKADTKADAKPAKADAKVAEAKAADSKAEAKPAKDAKAVEAKPAVKADAKAASK